MSNNAATTGGGDVDADGAADIEQYYPRDDYFEDEMQEDSEMEYDSSESEEQLLPAGNQAWTDETQDQLKTEHDSSEPEEQLLPAGNQGWTDEIPIRGLEAMQEDTEAEERRPTPEMPKRNIFGFLTEEPTSKDEERPFSEETMRLRESLDSDPTHRGDFVRWFFEENIRDAMQDAYLDGAIVGYKRRNGGADVPEDLMEHLREKARAMRYKPLDPEDVVHLDAMARVWTRWRVNSACEFSSSVS